MTYAANRRCAARQTGFPDRRPTGYPPSARRGGTVEPRAGVFERGVRGATDNKDTERDELVAVLEQTQGPGAGRLYHIEKSTTLIGRGTQADIQLRDEAVSRKHCEIILKDGTFTLVDCKSNNGTYLNGVRVTTRQTLADGDVIQLCQFAFTFHSNDTQFIDPVTGRVKDRVSPAIVTPDEVLVDEADISTHREQRVEGFRILQPALYPSPVTGASAAKTLDAVLKLNQALAQPRRIDELLDHVLETFFDIFPMCDSATVMLVDRNTGSLVVRRGRLRPALQNANVTASMTVARRAIQSNQTILIKQTGEHDWAAGADSVRVSESSSLMCVPIVGRSKTALGVIQLDVKRGGQPFSEEDLQVLSGTASPIGLALENAILQEEQQRAAMRLQELEQQLAQASRMQVAVELAAGIAHEMNQPLSVISTYLGTSADEAPAANELDDEIIRELAGAVGQAQSIMNRLRTFIKGSEFRPRQALLRTVIRELRDLTRGTLRGHRIELIDRASRNELLPPILCDRVQILQVLTNLVVNAAQVLGQLPVDRRVIQIDAQQTERFVLVDVSDDGLGMDAETRQHAFDLMYTTKSGGLGMGLPVSRRIMERHGGKLELLESGPLRGCCFRLWIPRFDASSPAQNVEGRDTSMR